ncbi:MAG: tryptophan--tRNA ligase [Clostridiales bacterium]|nr:tryptophan--tRNA ligase [Clostridiales bacterium]
MKKVLTGLQPTGVITLGNYIGAIQQMKDYQEQYDSYIFIADLHSITVPQEPEELRKNIKSLVALYIACGIEPEKNTIYIQSENEFIPCVSWLLECNSYYGELSRMTQFKDKSLKHANFTSGLLTYPVLMAADILGVDADYVPVGIDQKQHVELARDIAIRFNKKYGDTFVVPEPLIKKAGTKIYDLQNPTVKMSKSSENQKGVIRLLDDLTVTRKKIMSATTDSEMSVKFDMENKPGISNLINIYASLTGKEIPEIEAEFEGCNYGTFKTKVADVVVAELEKIQKIYNKVIDSKYLDDILDAGTKKMKEIFKTKYDNMKNKIGLSR